MRLLHITPSYKPAYVYGGPTMSVASLCEALTKAGVDTDVYTTTANGDQELDVIPGSTVSVDGVTVTYFKRITGDHTHFSPALVSALNENVRKYDIVHIHAWWNTVSVVSCAIAQRKGVPVIVSPRGMLSGYSFGNGSRGIKGWLHRLAGERLLNRSHIHATSDHEADAVDKLLTPLSVHTLPNFVTLPNTLITKQTQEPPPLKLIFFSRIDEKKGLDILIDALQQVSVPYHLIIAGTGATYYIEDLKKQGDPIAAHITWAGQQGLGKFDLLNENHLLVLPSHDENFGNVVIEALSVGTAVLVSTNVGLASYINRNNFGWVCINQPKALAQQIEEIAGKAADLQRIRALAPEIIRRDFTGDTLSRRYISHYEQIMNHEQL